VFWDVSERGSPFETSVTLYQYTRRNILKYLELQNHRCKNLEYRKKETNKLEWNIERYVYINEEFVLVEEYKNFCLMKTMSC